ncbi:MAG: cytochrome c3 family protein [Nitrospirota bacterium]
MKKTVFSVVVALAVLVGAYGLARAADSPHKDYRPGYTDSSCNNGGGAACHAIPKSTFLPADIADSLATDYTGFCVSCHNSAGEAHQKNPGSSSTNNYVNHTGININASTGNSHSWNGVIGNAGTRIPTLPGFKTDYNGNVFTDGTVHMVLANNTSYEVRCQTCHQAMKKVVENFNYAPTMSSDYTNYQISGASSTKQYLAQYIRVYRNGPQPTITNSRTKKQYLVDPSEYTYNYQTATVTFKVAQPSNTYINVDIGEPYLRDDNTANAVCVDCHADRPSQEVSHAPGIGIKSNHPASGQGISVNMGYGYGLHSTILPQATGNAYIENGKVYCTSCHKQHNAPSTNGELTRESDGSALCSDCHKTKLNGYSTANSVNIHNGDLHTANNEPATECLDCHTTHNSNNIMLIKNVINGKRVNFQSFTGARSFGPDTGFGICEVCHSATSHHLSNNDATGLGHNTGADCTICHSHSNGFQPTGGTCDACHGFPPGVGGKAGPTSYGWADTTGNMHAAHYQNFIPAKFPGLTGLAICQLCHGNEPITGNHPQNLNTANIDISSTTYWQGKWGTASFSDGGTNGKSNTADDSCTNVACHSTSGTRSWGGGNAGNGPYGLACDSCHEYPGSAINDWPTTNGHSVRSTFNQVSTMILRSTGVIDATKGAIKHLSAATAYNARTDYYATVTGDKNKCGKCHTNNPNHTNGTIVVVPNGYGAWGRNFNPQVIQSGQSARCTNVACHFNRETPNWY